MVQSSQGVRSTKNIDRKVHNNQMERSQQQSNTDDIIPNQKNTRNSHMGPTYK